jgi:hypothetical protein
LYHYAFRDHRDLQRSSFSSDSLYLPRFVCLPSRPYRTLYCFTLATRIYNSRCTVFNSLWFLELKVRAANADSAGGDGGTSYDDHDLCRRSLARCIVHPTTRTRRVDDSYPKPSAHVTGCTCCGLQLIPTICPILLNTSRLITLLKTYFNNVWSQDHPRR